MCCPYPSYHQLLGPCSHTLNLCQVIPHWWYHYLKAINLLLYHWICFTFDWPVTCRSGGGEVAPPSYIGGKNRHMSMLQRMTILLTPVMHQVRPYSQMDQDPPTPSCLYHTSIAIASGKVDTQESRDKIILYFFFLLHHGEYTTSNSNIPPFCLCGVALGWKVRLN